MRFLESPLDPRALVLAKRQVLEYKSVRLLLRARMPIRIHKVLLAKPEMAHFTSHGGREHARLIPARHALADYYARLTCFFPHGHASLWALSVRAL
jgi:hypothetical protein